jgi:hypothetical protein
MKCPNTGPSSCCSHCSVSYLQSAVLIVVVSGLNLFYSCHGAAVAFTASYTSHMTLWLILPIKLHSCTSLCARIHPSALSSLQLMLFSLGPVKYSVIICVAGGVSIQEVYSRRGRGRGRLDIETISPAHLSYQCIGTTRCRARNM